jgi:hypothetical protein
VHVRESDTRAERSPDRLARDDRLGTGDLRQRHVELRAGAVQLDLGSGAFKADVLQAAEQRPRQRCPRLLLRELGLFDGDVERDSNVPASTTCPGVRATSRTVPGSSLRRVTDRSARTVPVEVVVSRYWWLSAAVAVTDSIGSGWFAEAASAARREDRLEAARPAPVAATASSSREDPIQARELMQYL